MLPWQIRSVVQQVHGESQGKQLDLQPSTPYPGSTSAPGNTGTLYPGNTTASGNRGNIASTSTLHQVTLWVMLSTLMLVRRIRGVF
jgi:hypothetical protein